MDHLTGLNNLGNTCYLNSALQILVNCTVLSKVILSQTFRSDKLNIYKKFLLNYRNSSDAISPNEIKLLVGEKNNKFLNFQQHDSHEFLIHLLEIIDDEIKKEFGESNKKILNIKISDLLNILFDNNIVSIIYSDETNEKSKSKISEKLISLPLDKNCSKISDCINKFEEIEILKNNNRWLSVKEKKYVNAYKRLIIKKYAKYVIFHMKRFSYDISSSKNSKEIEFNEYINLNNKKYELRGIIIHMGSTEGGHYISIVKKNKWYLCNDSSFSELNNINDYLNNGYIYLYSKIK